MASSFSEELGRPVTLSVIAVAVVGWLLFVWSFAGSTSDHAKAQEQLAALQQQNQRLDASLKSQQEAAGALADIESKRAVATDALAQSQKASADVAKARDEAQAQLAKARDEIAQATTSREAAE